MWISAPSTSQLISMPGTMVSGGYSRAASIASARPSVESWSVTASTRTPRRTASATSSRGRRVPSELVVWVWRSTPAAIARAASLPASLERRDVAEQRPDGDPGGALGAQRPLALGEGGARDVEVRPRHAGRELAHEQAGHDRTRAALARDVV